MKDWRTLAQLIRHKLDNSGEFTPPPGAWEAMTEKMGDFSKDYNAEGIREELDSRSIFSANEGAWAILSARLARFYFIKSLKKYGAASIILIGVLTSLLLLNDGEELNGIPAENAVVKPTETIITEDENNSFDKTVPSEVVFEERNTPNEIVVANTNSQIVKEDISVVKQEVADLQFSSLISAPVSLENNLQFDDNKFFKKKLIERIVLPYFRDNVDAFNVNFIAKGQIWQNWEDNSYVFTPAVGLEFLWRPNEYIGISSGLQISIQRGMDVSHTITQKEYGLTKKEKRFELAPQLSWFLDIPLKIVFQTNSRNSWGLGIRTQILMDTKAKFDEYDVISDTPTLVSSVNQFGYSHGFRKVNSALEVSYDFALNSNSKLGIELIWGMTDLTDDAFFDQVRRDYNRGVNLMYRYRIFKAR